MWFLAIVFVVASYLLISILMVNLAAKFARKRGYPVWIAKTVAALCMYLLVFWDSIPVYIKHKELCANEAGFWVYQTPEEWIKKHPGVIGEEWAADKWGGMSQTIDKSTGVATTQSWLLDRIYTETSYDNHFYQGICKFENKIIDTKTKEILAKAVEFRVGCNMEWPGSPKIRIPAGRATCGPDADANGYLHNFEEYVKTLHALYRR